MNTTNSKLDIRKRMDAYQNRLLIIQKEIIDTQVLLNNMKLNERICLICGGSIDIRNPTGKCDHLYYPENLNILELTKIIKKTIQLYDTINKMKEDFNKLSVKKRELDLKFYREFNRYHGC